MYENSVILHYVQQDIDGGHQETSNTLNCEVSTISSPHLSNNFSSYSSSSSNSDEDDDRNHSSVIRKITKQHKSNNQHSPKKKKKRSLIGEIVMSTNSQPCQQQQLTTQQTPQIVFESFEGRKSSSHIPGTFSFSHKIDNCCNLSNDNYQQSTTQDRSNMCEVILSNWKSRSDTRQWIKKCIAPPPQDKKKKKINKNKDQLLSNTWYKPSSPSPSVVTVTAEVTTAASCNGTESNGFTTISPITHKEQVTRFNKSSMDRNKIIIDNNGHHLSSGSGSNRINNTWSDHDYIHTTCLIPGQRRVSSKSEAATHTSSPTHTFSPVPVPIHHHQKHSSHVVVEVNNNPWLKDSSTPNILSDVFASHRQQLALPSFREFVSTLGL